MAEGYHIEVKQVSKKYKALTALQNINFEVKPNELFGFIGPDGAGKTTLFRLLSTLLLPTEGSIQIGPYDAVTQYKKIRSNTGYMPGRFSLYQDLTVEENLEFYASIFGTKISENYHLIQNIYSHLEPFKTRRAGALSGGMKQKLALSCALIHKPSLLLLDEPTTGVDAVSRKEFWEMLQHLRNEGITIIVSTPYMDEANMCDRVALIQKGEILKIDSPKNIIQQFKNKLLAIRSGNIYKLCSDLKEAPSTRSAHLFGQFVHFTSQNEPINLTDLKLFLESKGHTEVLIENIQASIEDCFMDLMEKVELQNTSNT
jgi:ABC-2 type transport system ATP-binding protein